MYLSASRFLDPLLSKVRPKGPSSTGGQLQRGSPFFLLPQLSEADFYAALRERNVAYVLLPSFLNAAAIDLLIADDDLDQIGDLVTRCPGEHPINLYSVTGGRREYRFNPESVRPQAHYAVSLFPPTLAEALIGRATLDGEGRRALGPADAFLTCAYRSAYLQRECWTGENSAWIACPQCDADLRLLAAAADLVIDGPITPEKLDNILNEGGWRPSLDLLERAAHWMPWIRDLLPLHEEQEAPGLSLFFLRSRAVEGGWQPKIVDCLRENGFEPLCTVELDQDQVSRASVEFRGGNWGRGPYRVSGGAPAAICVALDLLPIAADDRHRAQFPDSDNRRTVDAKYAARDLVTAGLAKDLHYNPVHSTDNTGQTWRVIRTLIPALENELRQKTEQLRGEFSTDGAICDLTKHGRRAKVQLIEYEGKLAIRKTFRPSALHFIQREIDVMERLAPLCREIPHLLARGPNFIVMEYVGGGAIPPAKRRPHGPPKPLPVKHVRKLAELITLSMANGFDPIDLRADGNVIYTPSGLHLIDFEFWRPCKPGPPQQSMCLTGIPADDAGDQPCSGKRNRRPYENGWHPYTLLSLESFLHDPAPLQRVKRTANLARAYTLWAVRASSSLAKRAFKSAMRRVIAARRRLIGSRVLQRQ